MSAFVQFFKQEKWLKILFNNFYNPLCFLVIISTQSSIFHKYIVRLEIQRITMAEAAITLIEF